MSNPKLLLFLALGVVGLVYLVSWGRALAAGRAQGNGAAVPSPLEAGIGWTVRLDKSGFIDGLYK